MLLVNMLVNTATALTPPLRSDSLTLEQLRSRLHVTLQQLRKTAEQDERASRSLLATRLENLPLSCCHVAESSIAAAGKGVFASRDLMQGELVTLYPGDGLRIEDGGAWAASTPDGSEQPLDATVWERGKDYERELDRDHGSISLLGDPLLAHDRAYLGHMLNDGATCARAALRTAYVAESAAVCNVQTLSLDACHLAIVAARDIGRGEELLLAYGAGYWISRLEAEQVDYSGRLLEDYWIEDDTDEEYAQDRRRKGRRKSGRASRYT